MMINNQLTRRERVRLESLNMALRMPNAIEEAPLRALGEQADALTAVIFRHAEEVERWLLAAEDVGH